MKVRPEDLLLLLQLLRITRAREINCEEFLALLPAHLERVREGSSPARDQVAFEAHLELCPECREEHDGLMEAVDQGLI